MISPELARICKLQQHEMPDVFEAPCTVCKKADAQHMKLPFLGSEVSVCRECCVLKYHVQCIDSKWLDEYKYNPGTGTHEKETK